MNKKSPLNVFLAVILIGGLVLGSTTLFNSVQALTDASDIPTPSIPQFTVKFVNASYSLTTTDPYTGLNETKLIDDNSIEITIKNQPFEYSNSQIYYNVRVKPAFGDNWTEIYPLHNLTSSRNGDGTFSHAEYISQDSPSQSNSSSTVITFPVVPTELYSASGYDVQRYYSGDIGQEGTSHAFLYAVPIGGQLDFQIEALVGHDSQAWYIEHPLYPEYGGYYVPAVAYDSTSGWSETQTITIGSQKPNTNLPSTPTPSITPTPTNNTGVRLTEQEIILFMAIAVAVIVSGLGVLIYLIKRKKPET